MEKLDYKVGGKVGSRYVISLNKYFKVEFNVMIDDIVDWCVDRIFDAVFYRGVDGKVNISVLWVL